MIQVANIEISSVSITPSAVVSGGQFIISAIINPRIFGIMRSDGKMITNTQGSPIITTMPTTPVYGIARSTGEVITTADGDMILVEGD